MRLADNEPTNFTDLDGTSVPVTFTAGTVDIAAESYTVVFNANGGTVTPASATTNADGKLAALPTPTRDGFAFDGWYTAADVGEQVNESKVYTANTTLYAHWTETPPEHTHDWAAAWTNNATHHWHECGASDCPITANSGKNGYGAHVYDNDTDTTCNTCGYVRTIHTHSWATEWTSNANYHWHECTVNDCPITVNSGKDGYSAHTYDNDADTTCNICGYVRTLHDDEPNYISIPQVSNGTITPTTRNAEPGERVTLYVYPDEGYELDSITVQDIRGQNIALRSLGGNAYSFIVPNARVTVDASFVKVEADAPASTPTEDEPFNSLGTPGISGIVLNPATMPFRDVQGSDWFYNSVNYVWKHYLMSGVSETQFAPSVTTSRAMIWTILARMNNVRTDINPGSTWYEKGMLWAKEQGVTDGSDPMSDITREQLATMLWRNAGKPVGTADLDQFSDSNSVNNYAGRVRD